MKENVLIALVFIVIIVVAGGSLAYIGSKALSDIGEWIKKGFSGQANSALSLTLYYEDGTNRTFIGEVIPQSIVDIDTGSKISKIAVALCIKADYDGVISGYSATFAFDILIYDEATVKPMYDYDTTESATGSQLPDNIMTQIWSKEWSTSTIQGWATWSEGTTYAMQLGCTNLSVTLTFNDGTTATLTEEGTFTATWRFAYSTSAGFKSLAIEWTHKVSP